MKDFTKYQGIIPAFYACYDAEGNINPEGVRALTRYHIEQGVKGVYGAAPPASASTRALPSGSWFWSR